MNFILWIVFGGLAGWIASLIMGSDASMGLVSNILIGIAGAFLGGWIADKMGVGGISGAERPTSFVSFITAVISAVIILFLANLIF